VHRLMPIPARLSRWDAHRTRAPSLCRHYPTSSLLWAPPTSALATTKRGVVSRQGTPAQLSRVALCGVCTCCAQYPGGFVPALRFSHLDIAGLHRYQGGSTPAAILSRPAQASLALRPVHLLIYQSCRPLSLELRRIGRPLRLPGSYPGIPTIPGVGLPPTVTQHLSAAHPITHISVTSPAHKVVSFQLAHARPANKC
jgi:hypothetical protein